jgi:hypothetical protein
VSASSPSNDPGTDKRRTTRVVQAIPVIVRGMDALGQAFKESTSTVMVNCNGCKYRSRHYVPKDSRVTVEIPAAAQGLPPRIVPARVVWVQRPRTFREIFHVALEFEVPGNVWEMDSPPEDWFPHPDDEHLVVPLSRDAAAPEHPAEPGYIPPGVNAGAAAQSPQTRSADGAAAGGMAGALDRGMAFVMPAPSLRSDPEHAAARQLVTAAVEAAMAKEIQKMRDRLEVRLQESVQAAVKSLAQGIADTVMKDMVSRATEQTAAIVVEAREACQASADELEERIRQVVREVVSAEQEGPQKSSSHKKRRKSKKRQLETVAT